MNRASAGGREAPTPTGITVIRCIINLLSFFSQKSVKQGIRNCPAINFCLFHYIETQEQLDPNLCGTNHKMFSFWGKYKKIRWQKNEESAAAESAKGRLSRFILSASAKDLEISDHRKDKKSKKREIGTRNVSQIISSRETVDGHPVKADHVNCIALWITRIVWFSLESVLELLKITLNGLSRAPIKPHAKLIWI